MGRRRDPLWLRYLLIVSLSSAVLVSGAVWLPRPVVLQDCRGLSWIDC
jgi:hypothetical protein